MELNSGLDMFRVCVAFEIHNLKKKLWITARIFEGRPTSRSCAKLGPKIMLSRNARMVCIQMVATIKSAFLTLFAYARRWTSLVLVRRSCTRWLVQKFCGLLDFDPAICGQFDHENEQHKTILEATSCEEGLRGQLVVGCKETLNTNMALGKSGLNMALHTAADILASATCRCPCQD